MHACDKLLLVKCEIILYAGLHVLLATRGWGCSQSCQCAICCILSLVNIMLYTLLTCIVWSNVLCNNIIIVHINLLWICVCSNYYGTDCKKRESRTIWDFLFIVYVPCYTCIVCDQSYEKGPLKTLTFRS